MSPSLLACQQEKSSPLQISPGSVYCLLFLYHLDNIQNKMKPLQSLCVRNLQLFTWPGTPALVQLEEAMWLLWPHKSIWLCCSKLDCWSDRRTSLVGMICGEHSGNSALNCLLLCSLLNWKFFMTEQTWVYEHTLSEKCHKHALQCVCSSFFICFIMSTKFRRSMHPRPSCW